MTDLKDRLWGDWDRRIRTILAVLIILVAAAYLLKLHAEGADTEVMRDRYWLNAVPLFSGEVPTMEYPPLALVFIAIPYLFGNTPWGYETAWIAMIAVVTVIGLFAIARLARDLGRSGAKGMLVYTVLTLILTVFVMDRFDSIAMVITLGAVVMFVEKRYPWAFLLLAVGTLVKVYPALLFPVFFIYLAYGHRLKDAVAGTAVMLVTGGVVLGVTWLINPDGAFNFLTYNTGRPLQIESVASSLIYFYSLTGLTDVWIQASTEEGSFLSDNLRGDLPDAVADVSMILLAVALVLVWLFYAYVRGREPEGGPGSIRLFSLACLASILAMLAVNKVFSTQYLIWIIGPVVMTALVSEKHYGRRLVLLAVAAFVCGRYGYAHNVGDLGGGANIDTFGMLIILVKNVIVLLMLADALMEMWRVHKGLASPDGGEPSETPAARRPEPSAGIAKG